MAATLNTSANTALSPRVSAGEAVGGPHTPPRRTNSGSARNSSPTWNRIVRGAETEGFGAAPPPESLVTAGVPPPAEAVCEQSVKVKDGSSPEGSEVETQPEGADNGNGSKKAAWNKPHNAARETGLVMGAVSWPTLSESTKASPKPLLADSSKNPTDPPILAPQVATANVSTSLASPSSAPQKQMTSNPNQPSPNPNATQHHARPARQRSMKREGGGSSSSNGGFSHQFPQPSLAGDTLHAGNSSLKTSSGGGSDNAGRDHGHGNVTRDGSHRSGGDHPQQRSYRRNNSGSNMRGDGSFGSRRDQDRGNNDWNHSRGFNGRDPVGPPQRPGPRGFVRAPPPGAATYIPPPIRPYGSPLGMPPEMQPLYYFAPHPGMPFVAQMPPAVYYPPPLDPQLHAQITNQIDYYFSNENLVKDIYLRQNMDEYGWVPIQLIANFKKVMQLTTDIQLILSSVQASTVVEVQGDKIRKRDDWMKWVMPSSAQFHAAAGSQSPRLRQDALSARVQGLVLDEKTADYGNSSQVDVHAGISFRSSSRDMEGLSESSKDGRSSSGWKEHCREGRTPNLSLHAYFAIDNAKKAVERICPGVVSCADVLALAARDVVVLCGGPSWNVPKGRKDGRTSLASETRQLPAPVFNLSQLQQSFSQRGLSMTDLVTLSGGHTLGFAHCSSFQNRIHNFDSTHGIDPSLHTSFAASLRNICPVHNKVKSAGANMDPSPTAFDNTYYKLILQGKSLFSSDQALMTSTKTKNLVSKFAGSKQAFYDAFVKSMIKMSSLTGGQEVRKNCRRVN